MKKQNQASTKKAKTVKNSAQPKQRRRDARHLPCRVHIGPLVWSLGEYEQAERDGRFVTVGLTEMQAAQLAQYSGWKLKQFLPLATDSQLTALRRTTPLCLVEFFKVHPRDTKRLPQIVALRGRGPGGADHAWMRRLRAQIAGEIKRRS